MRVVAAGLSHRTAPVAVRERAALAPGNSRSVLRYLVGHAGLSAAMILSTCNRTEFYLVCPTDRLAEEVVPRLARYLDPAGDGSIADHLEARHDADAIRHIFRVAAGLESMVLGEAQVLGQLKAAHAVAREAGTLDARLDYVIRRATTVGKRVRTETDIGRRPGSVGEVAIAYAKRSLGTLDAAGVLLIGAGKMSRMAGRRLAAEGARLHVMSRGGLSAEALAGRFGGIAVRDQDLHRIAADIDVILCATSSAQPVLTVADVEGFQRERDHRRLCVLDIAVPRDVEAGVATIPGVELVDLDVLWAVLERNLAGRRRELPHAESIVESDVARTIEMLSRRDAAGSTIRDLTRRAEAIRSREVARTLARAGGLDAGVAGHIEVLTRSIVRKMLHDPIARLNDGDDDPRAALMIRDVFGLDGPRRPDDDPMTGALTRVAAAAPRGRRKASAGS